MKPGRPEANAPQREYPSPFQRKTLWTAVTGAALLGIGAMSVYTVGVVTHVLQFLQPVLVPIAFAGILAYLLQPLVDRLVRRGTPRFRAMMWVWIIFHLLILLLFLSVAVPTVSKGGRLIAARSAYETAELSISGRLSSVYLVQKAYPATKKFKPVRSLIVLGSVLFMFALSVVFVALLELYRHNRASSLA